MNKETSMLENNCWGMLKLYNSNN